MKLIFPLEVGDLTGLVVLLLFIMLGPPLLFFILGYRMRRRQEKKTANVLFIIGGVYLLIGLGICGGLMG